MNPSRPLQTGRLTRPLPVLGLDQVRLRTALKDAGCASTNPNPSLNAAAIAASPADSAMTDAIEPNYTAIYAEIKDGAFTVPAVKYSDVNSAFWRKNVSYATRKAPGTIVICRTRGANRGRRSHRRRFARAGNRARCDGPGTRYLWNSCKTFALGPRHDSACFLPGNRSPSPFSACRSR